jgi:NlpC/P60 family putative phage cell wall peptidase
MISREQIIAQARAWLGTRFQHQCSRRGIGVDCIGLIVGVGAELGLPEAERWRNDLRFKNYGGLPLPDKLLESCRDYLDPILVNEAKQGDVLLFTFVKEPMHFGFLSRLDPRYVIHAYSPIGRVVENILDKKWERRTLRAFHIRGVEWQP